MLPAIDEVVLHDKCLIGNKFNETNNAEPMKSFVSLINRNDTLAQVVKHSNHSGERGIRIKCGEYYVWYILITLYANDFYFYLTKSIGNL